MKLMIISYIVPQNAFLDAAILSETSRRSRQHFLTGTEGCTIPLLWLLLTHPAFATVAVDAFFRNNCIVFAAQAPRYDAPSPLITPLMQHVKINIFPHIEQWRWLAVFAQGNLGTSHLRSLELVFEFKNFAYDVPGLISKVDYAQPIVLTVTTLNVSYAYWGCDSHTWSCTMGEHVAWNLGPYLRRFDEICRRLLRTV
ncbi:hypothetical protein EK21DRAFT_110068 [Setomelanomma holmii]|uniref:Uncharacterized protein n=1 Tax=Setomelanomma holmii TaxID=210430 RepID=A0A9P4HCY6_9PLEO|nr:hypothetical protein EK21DRAFT_110068 [Setomelanomma holmii]